MVWLEVTAARVAGFVGWFSRAAFFLFLACREALLLAGWFSFLFTTGRGGGGGGGGIGCVVGYVFDVAVGAAAVDVAVTMCGCCLRKPIGTKLQSGLPSIPAGNGGRHGGGVYSCHAWP